MSDLEADGDVHPTMKRMKLVALAGAAMSI